MTTGRINQVAILGHTSGLRQPRVPTPHSSQRGACGPERAADLAPEHTYVGRTTDEGRTPSKRTTRRPPASQCQTVNPRRERGPSCGIPCRRPTKGGNSTGGRTTSRTPAKGRLNDTGHHDHLEGQSRRVHLEPTKRGAYAPGAPTARLLFSARAWPCRPSRARHATTPPTPSTWSCMQRPEVGPT